ncbi:hypothetical protein GDO86_007880 [Hymenochirus boettgeri]|uniref:Fatty-acid amide hydrolase 1 n=1 Tax=Hymenochirus boettgeri TaxID=247094 RepID=A0A8T2IZB4_9PIPI|nr:hypothetical protein GDO86_007880 [Hymenochirus boettgeri]
MQSEKLHKFLFDYEVELKVVAALGFCFAVSLYGMRWVKKKMILKRISKERKRRESSLQYMEQMVEKFKKQNPDMSLQEILNLSLPELTKKVEDGSIPPDGVLYSYVAKALEVNKDVNCVTVFMSDCETQLQDVKKRKQKGLLYGIPVSIKEHVGYQVICFKKQGAVIFVKTNVPQTLISFETSNPIYGHTVNPHNHKKGASGSTGGEGALIGGGGSVLGIGTDLGGSIRVPASFCGIAGFKPTTKRLSIQGVRPCIDGLLSVQLCIGPMARDVDSLALCMKALLCDEMFKLDPTVPPLLFNEEVYLTSKPLRIGYYETDGFTLPNPAMKRVLLETKTLLEEAGHTLIPFKPPQIDYMLNELFIKALLGDGGQTLHEKFKNNVADPHLKEMAFLCSIPSAVKKILSLILRTFEYQTKFIAEWRKLKLDVLLAPMLGPAFNTGYPGKLLVTGSYTMLFNIIEFPAGVVPVGSVTKTDEEELSHYKGHYNDILDKLFKKAVEGGVGLPLSVQCVALPYQDELCLRFMKEVETLHQNKKKKA